MNTPPLNPTTQRSRKLSPDSKIKALRGFLMTAIILLLAGFFIFGGNALAQQQSDADKPVRLPDGEEHVYKQTDRGNLHLYVIKPDGWSETAKCPAIVWFHGGGWRRGRPTQFNGQSNYLASRGMVAIQVEYRLLQDKTELPSNCIEDAKSAMRWIRNHAAELGIDPNRIAAGGGSAGGHLAAACALLDGFDAPGEDTTVPARPDALVLLNPVFDNGPEGKYAYELVGDRYREFSPAHNIKADAPPTLVLCGTVDKLIPVSTIKRFEDNMKHYGVRCDVVLYQGQGHSFFNAKNENGKYTRKTLREIDRFLTSLGYLSGDPTLKDSKGSPDSDE
jgi:acetyl esterase